MAYGLPPSQGIQMHAMYHRDPSQGAWDAAPYNIINDGPAGYTTPQGDSLSGQLNPGQGGMRERLQALLAGNAHQQPQLLPALGALQRSMPAFQQHFNQVHAAQNLARFLAQQHTAGLRRFQL